MQLFVGKLRSLPEYNSGLENHFASHDMGVKPVFPVAVSPDTIPEPARGNVKLFAGYVSQANGYGGSETIGQLIGNGSAFCVGCRSAALRKSFRDRQSLEPSIRRLNRRECASVRARSARR